MVVKPDPQMRNDLQIVAIHRLVIVFNMFRMCFPYEVHCQMLIASFNLSFERYYICKRALRILRVWAGSTTFIFI